MSHYSAFTPATDPQHAIGLDALAALGIGAAELGMSDADLVALAGAV
ncbi:hypothetical protein [Streptomyces sp. NPDC102264]